LRNNEKVIELLEKQIEMEKKSIRRAKEAIEGKKSSILQYLFNSASLDSMKHRHYCQTLIEILSNGDLLVRERMEIAQLVETHDRNARDLNANLEQIIKETDHPAAKLLLNEYERNGKRHNKILKQLIGLNYQKRKPGELLRHISSKIILFMA